MEAVVGCVAGWPRAPQAGLRSLLRFSWRVRLSRFPPQAIIEAAQLKEEGKVKKVVVTGCLAQRYSEELAGGAS